RRSQGANIGFAQQHEVPGSDYLYLDRSGGSRSPTEKRVVDVVEGLLRGFEHGDLSRVLRRNEVFARPISFRPQARCRIRPVTIFCPPAKRAPFLLPRTSPEPFQSSRVIVDSPQEPILTILQHPSVKNSQQADLLTFSLQKTCHIESNPGSFTHAAKVVRPARLDFPHLANVIGS